MSCFQNRIFGAGGFLFGNIHLVEFMFGMLSRRLQFIGNMLSSVDRLIDFFCKTLPRATLYLKIFFKAKRLALSNCLQ